MKRRIIILCSLISMTLITMAQEQAKINSLGLNFGMGNLKRQDLYYGFRINDNPEMLVVMRSSMHVTDLNVRIRACN